MYAITSNQICCLLPQINIIKKRYQRG